MLRKLTCLLVLLSSAALTTAQARADQPTLLTLSPTPAPAPTLRHRLLPDPREQVPGNAAALYYRSLALAAQNPALIQEFKSDDWHKWLEMPLSELPFQEVRDRVRVVRHLLREVELGAQRRQCDWQVDGRPEGLALIIPDVQSFRLVGSVLAVRARLEIADGQLPQALQTVQTGMTLARHLGEGPTFIHPLVGVAIAGQMADRLEELIQAPGSPNIYWSLTALPHPLFDLSNAFREETSMVSRMFSATRQLEKGVLTVEQVQAVVEGIHRTLQDFGVREPSEVTRLGRAALITAGYPDAKKALLARGYKANVVEAMPSIQVVYLDALLGYNEAWDELAKWYHVPYWQAQAGLRAAQKEIGRASRRLDQLIFNGILLGLGDGDAPQIERTILATLRVERRVAALRCVEAMRLHAARFGSLPAELGAIGGLPIPLDPVTGKPFEYQLSDGKAVLSAPPPSGVKPSAGNQIRYELTLRR